MTFPAVMNLVPYVTLQYTGEVTAIKFKQYYRRNNLVLRFGGPRQFISKCNIKYIQNILAISKRKSLFCVSVMQTG